MLCNRTLQQNVKKQRRVLLGAIHEHLQKYIARLPAFVVSTKLTCHIPGLTASVLYSFIANRCSHLSSQPESVWLASRHRDKGRHYASAAGSVDTICSRQILVHGESSKRAFMSD